MNRRELSTEITKIENRETKTLKKLGKLYVPDSLRKTICFTGPAGVGKSTLIAQLALEASLTQKIAWLACDPSSPQTGGSLLGDRVRLAQDSANDRLFVRSFATRSTSAFSRSIRDVEIYLESFFDQVWVETAGSGQTQSEVARLSAITVLILQPESGDDIQWMKSGVRDWADLFIINKADLPGSELMAESLIEHGAAKDRVILTSTKRLRGLSEVLQSLQVLQQTQQWKSRARLLHREHARSLFFESELKNVEKAFEKKSIGWIKNPYRKIN